jgi:cell division protein FtsQ
VLAVAIVAVPVALAAWFWSSPRFALADVQITTGERVPDAWVRERMGPFLDRNLLLLPLERVQRRLKQHPWVASISLRKEPPGRLHIRIEERQVVALLRRDGELLYVDNAGNPITPFMPDGKEVDLVILSQRDEEAEAGLALEFLQELKDAEVPWLAGLSEIRALGQKDFKVFTTNLPFPLLLRGGTVEYKARRLETLLPQIVARYGSGVEVDLRFARRIIVQPGPRMVNTQKSGVPLRIGVS